MPDEAIDVLQRDALIVHDGTRWRTTRRWQGAMSRAALDMMTRDDDLRDLRAPVAVALLNIYPEITDDDLWRLVNTMMPIEAFELNPQKNTLA